MSAELQDFRGKITPETHAVLEAQNQATGKDRSEIVRAILHEWALEQIHAANVLAQQLRAKGLTGNASGTGGNRRESRGASGNAGD
ncbi:MAG TPA: hypothetical protein VEA40_00425 [Ramlibacter sp.]|nr:hypothetical protein [Ramlibacter sp.]